jgi:hypothetical protein
MDPVLIQNLFSAIALALVGLVVYIVKGLAAVGLTYLEGRLGTNNLLLGKEMAILFVRTLKQSPIYEELDPAKKKELAIGWLTKYAAEKNLPFDYAYIDKLIEEAVHIVKAEKQEYELITEIS